MFRVKGCCSWDSSGPWTVVSEKFGQGQKSEVQSSRFSAHHQHSQYSILFCLLFRTYNLKARDTYFFFISGLCVYGIHVYVFMCVWVHYVWVTVQGSGLSICCGVTLDVWPKQMSLPRYPETVA